MQLGAPTDWFIARREMSDGRVAFIVPLTFGRARITIGTNEDCCDDSW